MISWYTEDAMTKTLLMGWLLGTECILCSGGQRSKREVGADGVQIAMLSSPHLSKVYRTNCIILEVKLHIIIAGSAEI